MRMFFRGKDGGPESRVWGYWLIEWKRFFSIAVLRFENGSREAFHTHAFNSLSWVLSGQLGEARIVSARLTTFQTFFPSFVPVITTRKNMHRVTSEGRSWVLTFRGPWAESWTERVDDKIITLYQGRKVIA